MKESKRSLSQSIMSSNNSELMDAFDENFEQPRRQITINVFKENHQLIEQTVTPISSARKRQKKASLKKQESTFIYQNIKNFIKEKNEKYMLEKVIDKNANDIISLNSNSISEISSQCMSVRQNQEIIDQSLKNYLDGNKNQSIASEQSQDTSNKISTESLDEFTERNDYQLKIKKINKKANQLNFNSQDRESLENANIDKNLLNNYFNESHENQNFIKDRFLQKHSRFYGYYIIPADQLYNVKKVFMKQKQQKFDILKNFYENEIRQLQKQIQTH